MGFFDALFGTDEEQQAITSGAIYGPRRTPEEINRLTQGMTPADLNDFRQNQAAIERMRARMQAASSLGRAGMAASQAGRQGGNFFDVLAAMGGGLSGGADQFNQSKFGANRAEIEARHASGLTTGGPMRPHGAAGQYVIGANGEIYELQADGSIKPATLDARRRYAGAGGTPPAAGGGGGGGQPPASSAAPTTQPQVGPTGRPRARDAPPIGTEIGGRSYIGGPITDPQSYR